MKNRKGVTVVELLIALFAIGLLSLVLSSFMKNSGIFFRRSTVKTQLSNESRDAMATMIHFLKEGQSQSTIVSTPVGGQIYSQIDFKLVGSNIPYRFVRSGNQLIMKVNNRTQILTQNCSSLYFTYPSSEDATFIQINFDVSLNSDPNRLEKIVGTQIVRMSPG